MKTLYYTIIDLDRQDRFSTINFEFRDDADRERNRLAIKYGKEFALGIALVDENDNVIQRLRVAY